MLSLNNLPAAKKDRQLRFKSEMSPFLRLFKLAVAMQTVQVKDASNQFFLTYGKWA